MKIEGKNKRKKQNGITLIGLVVTIIVLLILAGVSIAMLVGDNGILTQANNSKKQTDIATIKEEVELSMLDYTIKNYINKVSLKEHFIEDLKLTEDKVTHYESAKAIAFWYKNYLFVVDENEMKIQCMAGDIVKETAQATLYQDLLEEGKYVLEVKKSFGWNDRFWRNGEYINNLKNVLVDNSIEYFNTPQAFFGCTDLENIYLSENMKSLQEDTFNSCTKLKSIVLPKKLVKIENSVFIDCIELQNINLPNSLTGIGLAAFRNCIKLENIEIPEGITKIPARMFQYDSALTNVKLPESLVQISDGAFQFCGKLEKLYIPKNVKIIGDYAFNISDGVLKKVYYGGTEEEWGEIEIGVNNRALINATKYWYSEQKPIQTGNYWHYVNGKIEEWQ